MESIARYDVEPIHVLMLSILVLYLGLFVNRKIKVLSDFFIPPAVTGGLICSGVVAVIYGAANLEIDFDMAIRDVLLLVFFSTIGLSAKFSNLAAGGRGLVILVVIAAVFLVVQDATGVLLALMLDVHPGYGLFGGSVSFAGGHGTAIAWGREAEAAGLAGAGALGIAFATFGLIAGGLMGGPVARWLIDRNNLTAPAPTTPSGDDPSETAPERASDLYEILTAILLLVVCVAIGESVNRFLFAKGVLLPGFLTAMFVGIVVTNLIDVIGFKNRQQTVEKIGDVSLNIFLAMSLMSMKLWTIAGAVAPIVMVLMVQMVVITTFAVFVVFRVMGKDYDASVISAGFVGLGMGATPVAIANMHALTSRFGPSTKAFLIVPLVGAFFIDLLNAATIKFFIGVIARWFS